MKACCPAEVPSRVPDRLGRASRFEMEKYFQPMQPDSGIKAKRILELNTEHPVFAALEAAGHCRPGKGEEVRQAAVRSGTADRGSAAGRSLRLHGSGVGRADEIKPLPEKGAVSFGKQLSFVLRRCRESALIEERQNRRRMQSIRRRSAHVVRQLSPRGRTARE